MLALDLDRRSGLSGEAGDDLLAAEHLWEQELDRDLLVELYVMSSDDDPHPSNTENALHAVLAGDDLAFSYGLRWG